MNRQKNRLSAATHRLTLSWGGGLLGALLCLLLGGCADSVSQLNRDALESLERGEFAEAERLLKEAVRLRMSDRSLRRNLVEVYFRQEKWREAEKLLEATLSISGLESDAELRTNLAISRLMAGDIKRTNNLVRKLLAEDLDDEFLLFLDGISSISPKRAIQSLEKSLDKNPAREEAYFALARAHAYNGDTIAAREILNEIIERFGERPEVKLYEVSLYLHENDTEMARKTLKQIEADEAAAPQARLYQAYLALVDGKVEEAQLRFESLIGEEGITQKARLGDALCQLMEGDPNLAIEICEEIIEEDPDQSVAYNLLGLGQLKRLQHFLAKRNFEESLKRNPDQPAIQALVDRLASR